MCLQPVQQWARGRGATARRVGIQRCVESLRDTRMRASVGTAWNELRSDHGVLKGGTVARATPPDAVTYAGPTSSRVKR